MVSRLNTNVPESEVSIIGTLSIRPKLINAYGLTADLFGNEANRVIFDTLKDATNEKGEAPSAKVLHLLPPELHDYYIKVMDYGTDPANFEYHLSTAEEAAIKRKILDNVNCFNDGLLDTESLIQSLKAICDDGLIHDPDSPIDLDKTMNMISRSDDIVKCPNFADLFQGLNIAKNSMSVIGASSGVGKSAFALNLFSEMLKVPEYFPIYFNLEMSENVILKRLTAINTGIPVRELTDPATALYIRQFWQSMTENGFTTGQIQTGSKTVSAIKTIVSRASRANKGRHIIVFIDLLSHIKPDSGYKTEREQLAEISRTLLSMTKDIDCTIFLLQQLNREGYKAGSKADQDTFKGSGQTVEDADNAVILTDINRHTPGHERDLYHYYCLKVVKARNGALKTTIPLRAKMDTQRFAIFNGVLPEWIGE